MRKRSILWAIIIGLCATLAPIHAITGNYVEDTEHSFVGLIVFYDEAGEFAGRCSGALLTPTVFLTAGHCTDGGTQVVKTTARVYFQQDAGANYNPETQLDPVTGYPDYCAEGTLGVTCATSDELYTYPGYFTRFETYPDSGDVGLVILDQPINGAAYGVLGEAGSLDRLATQRGRQDVMFTLSGYGHSRTNPVQLESYRERLMATTQLVNLRNALTDGYNIQLTANPGDGKGGACFGDSGSPLFYGGFESNSIVAVTSFVLNGNCRGTTFSYRTDTTPVIEWIRSIVGETEFAKIRFASL